MQIPVQVTFRGMAVSDAAEALCWEEAARLDKFFDRITSCRVVIAQPHRQHRKGNAFSVRVDLTVPGQELVVNRDPPQSGDDKMPLAIREAFGHTQRQLEEYVDRLRGHVKTHP